MSQEYDNYIQTHKNNVAKAYKWIKENVPSIITSLDSEFLEHECIFGHDESKYDQDEYEAYDNYFYGNRSYEVVDQFNRAWLTHIHKNPHHWQYWILMRDEPDEEILYIDIPDCYIIEMICDWWSFSWKDGNLYEIFDWYDKHKATIKMSSDSRVRLELMLNQIKDKLDSLKKDNSVDNNT